MRVLKDRSFLWVGRGGGGDGGIWQVDSVVSDDRPSSLEMTSPPQKKKIIIIIKEERKDEEKMEND